MTVPAVPTPASKPPAALPNGHAPADPDWLAGAVLTLLNHYWREEDDPAVLEAMLRDRIAVLRGLPQSALEHARITYMRDQPRRRPTPGDLYARAVAALPKAPCQPEHLALPAPDPDRQPVDPDAAAAILARAGFTPDRFASARDNPLLGADRHLPVEDRERLEAERAARAERIRDLSRPTEAQVERARWGNPLMAREMRKVGLVPSWERESEHPAGDAA